ncbi:NCS2 family permease [Thomasclavelia saccharogumia]|uniref:NCS2 family permease n=1 Tax=Thomasclavelia saccharogumia TaxID=341225 RepID=UPI000478FC7A|nr:NCS2 family permease [Thomasclavelia saccharogumia]
MLERFFKLKKKGTTVKTEVIAGITTFLAMAYILAVNPNMLQETGLSYDGVFLATALSSGIATLIMGLLANYPVALAPGMGVNALFTYTLVFGMGYSPEAALAAVVVSGIIFLVISVTGIRKAIINAIPQQLKLAIGAGIGFFIAFLGFKNAGIIVSDASTFVALGDLRDPVVLLAIFGILVTIILMARKVPAAVFYGLIITAVVGVILGLCGVAGMPEVPSAIISFDLDTSGFGIFMNGFGELFSHPDCIVALFSLLFVDFFDTAGTLISVANKTNLVDKNGELANIEQALIADSTGTVIGGILGTSTVTSFVESTAGVEAGGRTGLTACTTAILFFLSIFFAPVLSVVTNAVTAPALIAVGISMATQLGGIEWDDIVFAAAGFITVIMMVLTYSISDGIAFGFIVYGLTSAIAGRAKDIKPIVWILILVFIAYFALI